ncbi:MAG: hypothetical protein ACE1Y4_14505, partial [Lysobacterales bacterium]
MRQRNALDDQPGALSAGRFTMICEVAMAQNGITSSKSTCVGVWGASRLDGERGSTSRKLESAICCAMPFPVLPDPIGDR